MAIGQIPPSPAELRSAVNKLNAFQESLVDRKHIEAINNLIPDASELAEQAVRKGESFNRVFHRQMNTMARRAELRN